MPVATTLSPFVHWAQTKSHITLKIDLNSAKEPQVDLTPTSLDFSTYGSGARGVNNYRFVLDFYGFVNSSESKYKLFDSKIEFTIRKFENGWWPRLIATPQKPHWLKIDFDRWRTEEEYKDEMAEEEEKPRNVMEDYSSEYDKLQKVEYGYIKESTKKVYMVFYNLAQFIGYLYIVVVMSVLYYRDGTDFMPKTFTTVGNAMKFCQLLQFLEVLHPIFGYTKGGPWIPLAQVTGRNFVLFIMIDFEERIQTKPVIFYLFFIWAFVEIFRYPYYISQILKRPIYILTWLRYTIWVPLYPMGILCEGIIIIRNIPYFEETKRFCVEMPNQWNFVFDMPSFLKVYLLFLILPGSYLLMKNMSNNRTKKIGSGRKFHGD